MELFKIRVKNLGKIKEAELDIRPLTVFCGPNNTNKTWVANSIYGLARRLQMFGWAAGTEHACGLGRSFGFADIVPWNAAVLSHIRSDSDSGPDRRRYVLEFRFQRDILLPSERRGPVERVGHRVRGTRKADR